MKKICITFILVLTSLLSFSQEETELFGEWFLHYRSDNGAISYPPLTIQEDYNIILRFSLLPPNASIPFVIRSYGPTTSTFEGRFMVENGVMTILNVAEDPADCLHPVEVCSFFSDYNNAVLFDSNTSVEPEEYIVTYEITVIDDDTILTITNNFSGDYAVYGANALSVSNNEFYSKKIALDRNPVSNSLDISTQVDLTGSNYDIFSITGQRIVNGKLNSSSINVSQLHSGLYFLKVSKGENVFETVKFIKD